VFGLLATDRPHQFKFFGNYEFKTRAGTTDLSVGQYAYSGTPLSSEVTFIVPVFFNGRGDLGRTPAFTQTDLLFTHTVLLTERVKLKFDMNVLNALNQATVVGRTTRINRNGNLPITTEEFFQGFDTLSLINPANSATPPAFNPISNLPSAYQAGREIRLGFHLHF
jgi:hypothetical protein